MKKILLFALLLVSVGVFGQSKGYLRYDTLVLQKVGGNAELVIMNGSRNELGVLVNMGGGRTQFVRSRISGDTLFIGKDTLTGIGTGGGGTGGASRNIGSAYRVYMPDSVALRSMNIGRGLSADTATVGELGFSLGQTIGASGDPALVSADREIPFNDDARYFTYTAPSGEVRMIPAGAVRTFNPLGGGLDIFFNPTGSDRAFPGVSYWRSTAAAGGTLLVSTGVDLGPSTNHYFIDVKTGEIKSMNFEFGGVSSMSLKDNGDAYIGALGTKRTIFASTGMAPRATVDIVGTLRVNDSTKMQTPTAQDTTGYYVLVQKSDSVVRKIRPGNLITGTYAITITSANFSSATEYDDPRLVGKNVRVFLNEINRFLDSTTEVSSTATGIEITLPGFDAINNTYNLIIYSVVPGIAGIGLPINLTIPPYLEPNYDLRVRRRPDGTFYTTYDWTAVRDGITGAEIWVDPVLGSDANIGTQLAPKKSIAWVLQFSTANIVHLAPKWYNYEEAFNGVDINRDIKFLVDGGIAYITTSDTVGAWTSVVSNPGAYESTYSGPAAIESPVAADFSNKDINGVPIRLTPVTSIAAVAATPNSVFAVNGTNKFYVHTYDSRAPDDSIKVFFEKNAVECLAPYTLYFENMRFMAGGSSGRSAVWFDNATGSGRITVVMKNCWVAYALTDGTGNFRDVTSFWKDCVFAYNGQDGNDWDRTSIGLEEDCIGYHNGYTTVNDANNGSTAHGNSKVIRVNGVHKYNGGRNVHDIEYAGTYNVNMTADSSRGIAGTRYSFVGGGSTTTNVHQWWIDATALDDNGYGVNDVNSHGYFYNTNKASTANNFVGDVFDLTGYQFTTRPIVLSATVLNATTIRVTFNEVVTATNVGWSFKMNGAAHNPTAVSGSGGTTLDFTVPTMTSSDVISRTYSMTTGDTMNASSLELVNFTDNPVTNNI